MPSSSPPLRPLGARNKALGLFLTQGLAPAAAAALVPLKLAPMLRGVSQGTFFQVAAQSGKALWMLTAATFCLASLAMTLFRRRCPDCGDCMTLQDDPSELLHIVIARALLFPWPRRPRMECGCGVCTPPIPLNYGSQWGLLGFWLLLVTVCVAPEG